MSKKLPRYLLQYFLGLILLATGLGKLLDVPGFIKVIESYEVLPQWSLAGVAVFMVVLELKLAELLLFNRQVKIAAATSILMHVAFTLWAITALLRGLDIPNCGCFGVFWARPLTWTTVIEDLVMLAVSAGLFALTRKGQ